MFTDHLIEILEVSVEKNGEQPLTNKWLLNILKMAERRVEQEASIGEVDKYDWYK